ncbi:hypothetical protein [Winogradskyella sp. SYSU M77433]|uniref:hypothetical protein n=1 Tax=Winogradskyella sp. SYSU M77433 TaxID=3042722 RepID=UPI0024817D8D|nr:hypothetical protein [Winogradskyella sp. SYSU M77433]MDH7911367.1 hypothetical protein [Winogradskyella sp. SYSU M77433]
MAEKNRTDLKAYFEEGDRPTESQFEDLIDSFVNRLDDDFVATLPDGNESQKGIVQQASESEVGLGVNNSKYVTPLGAKTAAQTFAPVQSVNGQTGTITIASSKANWLYFGGRFYMNTNNRWVGVSIDYGQEAENKNQNHGTGTTPSVVWNSLGIGFLPQNTILHSLELVGRVNNAEVTGIEVQLSCQGNNLDEGIGYDSIAEALNEVILPPTSLGNNAPSFQDMQRHILPLGDFVLDRDRIIEFCCRPVGTITATRMWIMQGYLHFTLP